MRRLSTFSSLSQRHACIMTIFMAILCREIMANINKMAIMAILVWVDMAINMANIGVYAKSWQNVDSLRKQIGKICIG